MRATFHLKTPTLIVGSALCCAFLGHAQVETRDSARTAAWGRRWDSDRVGFAFSLGGKVYESELTRASIIAAPAWTPSDPSPFPAHKAVEAAAPVARSVAGSIGLWRVSQICLYSLGPAATQSWYYGVFFQPPGPRLSSEGVIVAVDLAGRVGPVTAHRTRDPWGFGTSTNTQAIRFVSSFDGKRYDSILTSQRIKAAPEWVLPQPSPFPVEKAVGAAFQVAHSLVTVRDVDAWYVSQIRLYSLPQRPESWCYSVWFWQEGRRADDRSIHIGVDFAGRVGAMSTNEIRNVASEPQLAF